MDIVRVFGDNLRKYRNKLGLSQEAFAEKCGLHRTYISAIECYRRSIALENVQRIADALGIETYKLFLEEQTMREITEEIRQEITDMIFDYYAEECEVDRNEITMDTNPQEDLGSDSLMFVELIEMTAEKYDLDVKLQSIGKYMLKAPMDTMSDVVTMFCKIYQYGNDIVNQ